MAKNENKKPVHLFYFQCHLTDICENEECPWKKRDCYHIPISAYDYLTTKFPTIKGSLGTNEITIWCEDFMKKDWKDGWYDGKNTLDNLARMERLRKSIYSLGFPKNE